MKDNGKTVSEAYSEIDVVREIEYLRDKFPEDEKLKKLI